MIDVTKVLTSVGEGKVLSSNLLKSYPKSVVGFFCFLLSADWSEENQNLIQCIDIVYVYPVLTKLCQLVQEEVWMDWWRHHKQQFGDVMMMSVKFATVEADDFMGSLIFGPISKMKNADLM